MKPYRHPKDMAEKDNRVPVSARINPTSLEILTKASVKYKKPLARLIGTILDDYAEWLKTQKL